MASSGLELGTSSSSASDRPHAEPSAVSERVAPAVERPSGKKSPRRDVQREEKVQGLRCRADLLASRGRYDEAPALVDEAISVDPQNPDLHLGKGQCLAHLG